MAAKRATTIAGFIRNAPSAGQPHLRRLHAILKKAAPKAKEEIKWGMPFFVEPRFLFSFSAHKAHLSFAPTAEALQRFRKEIGKYETTKNFLKIHYDQPFPDDLIRKIAECRVRTVRARKDDGFW